MTIEANAVKSKTTNDAAPSLPNIFLSIGFSWPLKAWFERRGAGQIIAET
jgi:hypothetical protein